MTARDCPDYFPHDAAKPIRKRPRWLILCGACALGSFLGLCYMAAVNLHFSPF